MTVRKLPAAFALAGLVGVLAHVAASGFEHAPGRGGAAELLSTVAAGLALAAALTFLRAALGRPLSSIATRRRSGYEVPGLAAGGFAAYALIELAEGHLSLGGMLRAVLAVLPISVAVLALAGRLDAAAARAGTALAALISETAQGAAVVMLRPAQVPAGRRTAVCGRRLGRAPPILP
jgi:hypothetical protein